MVNGLVLELKEGLVGDWVIFGEVEHVLELADGVDYQEVLFLVLAHELQHLLVLFDVGLGG